MSDDQELYLIWSHEHGAWWAPGGYGYVRSLAKAGRYSRAEALKIATNSIPGTAAREGALPELPVRLADVTVMRTAFRAQLPHLPTEAWE